MKKFLLSVSLAVVFLFSINKNAEAQYVTIPDTAFVNWLNVNGYSACMTGNQMDTTCSDLIGGSPVGISGINIHDLFGLQYFQFIDQVQVNNTSVDSIFYFPQLLTYASIYLDSNSLLKYIDLPQTITYNLIGISHCAFTEIPLLPNDVDEFNCSYNFLTTISNLPTNLIALDCNDNMLTELNLTGLNLDDIFTQN